METLNDEYGDPEDIKHIFEELENMAHLPGPIKQKILRCKAFSLLAEPDEELNMILNLVESHTPGLELRAEMENDFNAYNRNFAEPSNNRIDLDLISSDHTDIDMLLQRVAELPKEWTVVQLTPQFSSKDIFALTSDDLLLGGVHMTVFNCGKVGEKPYCVTLPGDNISSIRGDMRRLKNDLKEIYSIPYKKAEAMSTKCKKMYHMRRIEMEDVLDRLLQDTENSWLGGWRCLLIGKFVDNPLESKIHQLVGKFLKEVSHEKTSEKVRNILVQTVKSIISSTPDEPWIDKYTQSVLEYCFPHEDLVSPWKNFWNEHELGDQNKERHPVILVVDEALDAFPWEMLFTLYGHPTSRISSLNLLYATYKAHKDTIVDGYKIISDPTHGRFILNPGLDLLLMERRLSAFFEYWLPEWTGLAGKAPTTQEFLEALNSTEIFSYSGHGAGTQYCSSDKIQKAKIDSVALLFGCGSSQLFEQGPSVEMYGCSQMYSLAGCPCLIGMLWVVTDIDTDLLTTNFLSTWIPNSQRKSWKLVNEKEWIDKGIVSLEEASDESSNGISNEPNLLKALYMAKRRMVYNCNRAAVVVRGIPVKIKNS